MPLRLLPQQQPRPPLQQLRCSPVRSRSHGAATAVEAAATFPGQLKFAALVPAAAPRAAAAAQGAVVTVAPGPALPIRTRIRGPTPRGGGGGIPAESRSCRE